MDGEMTFDAKIVISNLQKKMWESCYRTDDIREIYKFEEKLGE